MACEQYIQPDTLKELVTGLAKMTSDSVILAGGTDLIIKLRSRHMNPDCMLSLCRVPELKSISESGGYLRIGAMETHDNIANNTLVRKECKALAMACSHVGSQQVRNKGTIGGSLGNASVAGDMLPVLVLFHGLVEILDSAGKTRKVDAQEFTLGIGRTILQPQEVIMAVWLPLHSHRESCFIKLGGRREVTIAEISLAFSWERSGQHFHKIEGVLGAVDTKPIYLQEVDEILEDRKVGKYEMDLLADSLSKRIRAIRENRKRQPRLRIQECEKVYKERAVKGIVYDALEIMMRKTDKKSKNI